MRIDSSVIGMESTRRYTSVAGRISRMVVISGRQNLGSGTGTLFGDLDGADGKNGGAQTKGKDSPQDALNATYEEMKARTQNTASGNIRRTDVARAREQLLEIRQQCLNYLMQIFFPERRRTPWEGEDITGERQERSGTSSDSEGQAGTLGLNLKTFAFSTQYYREERETTGYTTQGTVKCADGREINFNLNVEMSRSFQEYYEENVSIRQVSMCDPLVINLSGNIADLSDQTFLFDIDGDGEEDEINRLAAGSGFLALDKNGDGIINDGSELFGTRSGNGFADLAAYDTDHNGFIDEGDEIWDKLKIWVMDENGNQQLYSFAEKGVGAICLQNASTDFALTDEKNEVKGMVRNTGFFLYENGNTGTVQHVDLALHGERTQAKVRQNQDKYTQWMYRMA